MTKSDDSKVYTQDGPIFRIAFDDKEELCKQTTALSEQLDDTKIISKDLQPLENPAPKKSTKWLKTVRKSANTWIKKHLNTS